MWPSRVAILVFLLGSGTGLAQGGVGDSSIAIWKDNAKAAYSLTTDDNRPSQVYTIAPALTERGLHGTFYVNPTDTLWGWRCFKNVGDVNDDGLADGYLHLPSQGHELASHTKYHYAVTVESPPAGYPDHVFPSYEALAWECSEVNQYLEDLTGQPVVSFAYPWGMENERSRSVINGYYLSARDVSNHTPTAPLPNGHYVPNAATPTKMSKLDCFMAEGGQSWCDFRNYEQASVAFGRMLGDTVAAGGWGIEFMHATGTDNVNHYSGFESVDRDAYYEHLNNLVESVQLGNLWQESVGNVSRYIYSRGYASITCDSVSETGIELRVDDSLDDDLFCVPVTVNTLIPESWSNRLVVTHDGELVEHTVCLDLLSGSTYVSYDVVADGAPIVIGLGDPDPAPSDPRSITILPPPPVPPPPYYSPDPPPPPPPVLGDLTGDGFVGGADLDLIRLWWGQYVTSGTNGDGTGDGFVGADDLDMIRLHWGNGVPPIPASVPEASTLIYLLAMGAALLVRRRFGA